MVTQNKSQNSLELTINNGISREVKNVNEEQIIDLKKGNIVIKLINIQGLSQVKASEVEDTLDDFTLFCLTETKQKCQNKRFKDDSECITSVRDRGDTEGGDIMILYKKKFFQLEKQSNSNCDILHAKCKVFELYFHLIVTYFDTIDYNRNFRLKANITGISEKCSDSPVVLLGDFNGHLGFIGKQTLDKTGNIVLDIAEKYNMVILNGDPLCDGDNLE